MPPFRFFSLPPELRNIVYAEVLASPTDTETALTLYQNGHTQVLPCSIPTNLLLTNRQIHTEASPLLWIHRYWQSRIVYESSIFDFREPLWCLPPPSLLPLMQNLEITIKGPKDGEYDLEIEDPLKRQKELSGTLGKLLAVLCDEVAFYEPRLKNVVVHLPCLCTRCDSPQHLAEEGSARRGPHWEPPDMEWKKGVTPLSLSILLHPLKRLRVSESVRFLYRCVSPFPAQLKPVLLDIAQTMGGAEPVGVVEGERGVFRDLWMEAREKGCEDMIWEDLKYALWDMDDGFPGRRDYAAGWFSRQVEIVRMVLRGEEGN